MQAHVIMCNDSVQFVVIDDEQKAEAKKAELQKEYFDRDPWAFDKNWEKYKRRCYWHIKTVDGTNSTEAVPTPKAADALAEPIYQVDLGNMWEDINEADYKKSQQYNAKNPGCYNLRVLYREPPAPKVADLAALLDDMERNVDRAPLDRKSAMAAIGWFRGRIDAVMKEPQA